MRVGVSLTGDGMRMVVGFNGICREVLDVMNV